MALIPIYWGLSQRHRPENFIYSSERHPTGNHWRQSHGTPQQISGGTAPRHPTGTLAAQASAGISKRLHGTTSPTGTTGTLAPRHRHQQAPHRHHGTLQASAGTTGICKRLHGTDGTHRHQQASAGT